MTIEEEKAHFLFLQEEFLATGDVMILWRDMLPYLEKVCRSCFKKLSNGHFVHNIDDMTDKAVDCLAKRYLKKNYKNGNPVSMCKWVCYGIYYGDEERNLSAEREIIAELNRGGRCRLRLE